MNFIKFVTYKRLKTRKLKKEPPKTFTKKLNYANLYKPTAHSAIDSVYGVFHGFSNSPGKNHHRGGNC